MALERGLALACADTSQLGPSSCSDPSGCAGMPAAVRSMVNLLGALDAAELAEEPCRSVFGP